ncbi:MAG: YkgJ family cysteine cluster protein [Lachnospiraceae bacterium]|nr:YkgJ family cysteine cluster protein [Lachnospiraceae bacterium]
MLRECDINEISDGKRYCANDMVKLGCNDCRGCHSCCEGMEDTIVLDPYDIYRLTRNLDLDFQILMQERIALHVEEGLILPHLAMSELTGACSFLNEEGRCSIHAHRPGICRLFPLGRIYENGGFSYFLQVNECVRESRTKEKVKNWIDTPRLREYEAFILKWHNYIKEMQSFLKDKADAKDWNMLHLQMFYILPYESEDFYLEFEERLVDMKRRMSV